MERVTKGRAGRLCRVLGVFGAVALAAWTGCGSALPWGVRAAGESARLEGVEAIVQGLSILPLS